MIVADTSAIVAIAFAEPDLLRLPMFEITQPGPAEMDTAYAAFVAFCKVSFHRVASPASGPRPAHRRGSA